MTVEPVETLTLGAPTSDRAGANIGSKHFLELQDILGNVADNIVNNSLSNEARTLFGQYNKSIKSVAYSGWQTNAINYIKFDWDRLIALKLNRNFGIRRNMVSFKNFKY